MMPAIYGNSYDITQAPGLVAIRYEMVHETRIIPLDDRPRLNSAIKSYMGDARGHWEGETLVVVTTNYREAAVVRWRFIVSEDDRAVHALRSKHHRLVDPIGRPAHLDAPMELRHAADARPRGAGVRVRLPRGQRGHG